MAVSAPSTVGSYGVDKSWKVDFAGSAGNPSFTKTFDKLVDWTESDDPAVRYYSGHAVYSNTFALGDNDLAGSRVTLDLGEVMVLATVKVNDSDAGGVWTFPYRLDISGFVRPGVNTLEVTVYNNWRNRLIADEKLPMEERRTWTNIQPWSVDDALQRSGLLGPVEIKVEH